MLSAPRGDSSQRSEPRFRVRDVENDGSASYRHLSCSEGRRTVKEGDVVQLRSSGIAEMIVTRTEQIGEQTVVSCVWFDEDYHLQRAAFPADSLKPIKLK